MDDEEDGLELFTTLSAEMAEVFSCSNTKDVKFTLLGKSECKICLKEIPSSPGGTGNISNLHKVINMRNVFKCLFIPEENCDLSFIKETLQQSERVCRECLNCLVDISTNVLLLERLQRKLDRQRVSLGRNLILNSLGKTEEDFFFWKSHLGIQTDLDVQDNEVTFKKRRQLNAI